MWSKNIRQLAIQVRCPERKRILVGARTCSKCQYYGGQYGGREDCTHHGIPGGTSWEDHLKDRWKHHLSHGEKIPAFVAEFTIKAAESPCL